MSERRRAGAMVIPKGRPPADRALLQPQSIVAQDHQTDSWRVLRFIAEFVEGFDALSEIGTAVTCFGSARTRPDQTMYRQGKQVGAAPGRPGGGGHHGRGP